METAAPIKIIGLTGGIGSGKSTVANLFQAMGVPLIDTDLISHQLGQPGGAGSLAVSRLFGAEYLNDAGAIDRGKLRMLVFGDARARKQLEAALHPLIRTQVETELDALPVGTSYCLLIVPLLFETGAYQDLISQAWVVDCTEEQQIERVMARSQLSREQALAIMSSQISREQRLSRADVIINNGADRESLLATVKELHSKTLQGSESAYKSC